MDNSFHFNYYCLKFKKQFRDWLWIKVREKKVHSLFSKYLDRIIDDVNVEEILVPIHHWQNNYYINKCCK